MKLKNIIDNLVKLIDPSLIEITNIATLNDGDEFLSSKSPIILSIVNIEEDKTLKNQSVYLKNPLKENSLHKNDPVYRYKHPSKHLIISLLFSSYDKGSTNYLQGIEKLEIIINFFQQNISLYCKDDGTDLKKYEDYAAMVEIDIEQKKKYSAITFESVSLTMEQLNQMWSYLGSKYMPSVLFKMRLITVESSIKGPDEVIEEIKVNLWENDKADSSGLLESKIYSTKPE